MTTGTNEAYIGQLDKNCYLTGKGMTYLIVKDVNILRWIFLIGEMCKFLALSHKGLGG